jgi:hypothetical protein
MIEQQLDGLDITINPADCSRNRPANINGLRSSLRRRNALIPLLDSPVPLKWCLALGSIYGVAYFGLMLVTVGADFLPGLFCFGMLISPVLGGPQAKRRAIRKTG